MKDWRRHKITYDLFDTISTSALISSNLCLVATMRFCRPRASHFTVEASFSSTCCTLSYRRLGNMCSVISVLKLHAVLCLSLAWFMRFCSWSFDMKLHCLLINTCHVKHLPNLNFLINSSFIYLQALCDKQTNRQAATLHNINYSSSSSSSAAAAAAAASAAYFLVLKVDARNLVLYVK